MILMVGFLVYKNNSLQKERISYLGYLEPEKKVSPTFQGYSYCDRESTLLCSGLHLCFCALGPAPCFLAF